MKHIALLLLLGFLNNASAQEADSTVIRQVDSLIQVSKSLSEEQDYKGALKVNAVAEKLALEHFGRESALYATCASRRGSLNQDKGDLPEAEKWYLETKAIQEKALGREHPDYASSLNSLGEVYFSMGQYEKAEPLFIEAKAIQEKTLGREHPDYAYSLYSLAVLYSNMGQYEKAEPLYIEGQAILGKTLGREHPDYAYSLYSLAVLYANMGQYDKAEPLFIEAKAIQEKTLGREHPDYAYSLNNLGVLYLGMGQYEKAEPLYKEGQAILEKTLGREHPDYAYSLGSLAILYSKMGQYEKAELLYIEAKAINEKTLGREHPNYAYSLNSLGGLYMSLGQYEKAEPLLIESRAILGKTLGREYPDYAYSLNSLGVLYMSLGQYDKAEPLYIETKAIWEKTLGREHPDYAHSLNSLAVLYVNMGQYEKAETLYIEAKAIQKKTLGREHPDYAHSLNSLGDLYSSLGQYEKAEPLFIEAKAIREKALGREHPDYTKTLNSLSAIYETQSRFSDAEPLMQEALTNTKSRLVQATSFLSERELAKYLVTFQDSGDKLNSYLFRRETNGTKHGMLPHLAYDHALFYKGFLLTAASRLNATAQGSAESTEILLRLKGYRRRLAAEYAKPIVDRKGIEELEEKANLAEKELARTVSGYAEAIRQVRWQDVRSALAPDAIAVEFVHYRVNFPAGIDSVMYAALVLRTGAEHPLFIPLFEEREFEHLLDANKERKADYVNELYAWADRGMVVLKEAKRSLYELIWAKIEAIGLEGIQTVYYSPSGVLHRLNLGAMAADDESILSDRYNLVALNSTRQLVVPASTATAANDALLVGGVNFEAGPPISGIDDQPILASRSAAEAWKESGNRGGTWTYLKWTQKEVERIASSLVTAGFDAVALTDSLASEEAIKSLGMNGPSPRVLHIATHGFFFPDPKSKSQQSGSGDAEPAFKWSDNSMIRSGLILAGGNYAWQQGQATSPEKEDGILTAYEISQMNLSNTELVVLSACETGLGDIQGNEGVYGLQRAFKIAGAKYLIMSLWQVPDRETMEFMSAFYKNWLEGNMTIPDAFRTTQREMRDRFFNPYSWAGFVLVE